MMHIADVWKLCEAVTAELAGAFPDATFTCVRDLYGRCSFYVEGIDTETLAELRTKLEADESIRPYLGTSPVQAYRAEGSVGQAIRRLRKRLDSKGQAYYVERLLSNESWIRDTDRNPKEWPPVVAFYSFKGGVGRTTTAAMTALTLAREGKRVVVVDLDLEAPGIEGYFFDAEDPTGKPRAGVVDYLLEREIIRGYKAEIDDFVLPFSDAAIAASGGSLVIVPAGRLDDSYMERLGRLNLADIGRKSGDDNPLRALIGELLAWRPADVVIVDCRTGFTDLGGITLNGLSTLDVLVFRGGESDRRYLPIVLGHIRRFREDLERTPEVAERLARSFLVVFTMVEIPPKADEAEQYLAELRRYTGEACWTQIFQRFAGTGYAYPSDKAIDSPLEAVPHDVVLIPYLKDFFLLSSVADMLRLQAERPERPYDTLVRRIVDVKLAKPAASPSPVPEASDGVGAWRARVLEAIEQITGAPSGEDEFVTDDDFRRRFLPRAAYRTLLDPRSFLVLGRKGAGKSALFQLLKHRDFLRSLSQHLGVDSDLVEKTHWEVGFSSGPGFPVTNDFQRVVKTTKGDPDLLSSYWRALAALRLSEIFKEEIPGLKTVDDCIETLQKHEVQRAVQDWLEQLDKKLEKSDRFCCLSYDDLDTGLTRDERRRSLLVSALVAYWQQAPRRWSRLRAKIFLREDIWNREVDITDKAKVRDGIDRATITWDGPDIYRTVIKRLGHQEAAQKLFIQERLWRPEFDRMLEEPLGFVPPDDEDWIQKCVHVLAGEKMAPGPSGHKKGYVYTWILKHISDAADLLRPRNALLLFSEAAKVQGAPTQDGPILAPRSFVDALRGEVSRHAVQDLRAEFKREWTVGDVWLPDKFPAFERIWPVSEDDLIKFLRSTLKQESKVISEKIKHMIETGLIERRTTGGRRPQLQIPDIYLFGLNLTRKG